MTSVKSISAQALLQKDITQALVVDVRTPMMYDPRWPWHAAAALGQTIAAPAQYLRCKPHNVKDLFA